MFTSSRAAMGEDLHRLPMAESDINVSMKN